MFQEPKTLLIFAAAYLAAASAEPPAGEEAGIDDDLQILDEEVLADEELEEIQRLIPEGYELVEVVEVVEDGPEEESDDDDLPYGEEENEVFGTDQGYCFFKAKYMFMKQSRIFPLYRYGGSLVRSKRSPFFFGGFGGGGGYGGRHRRRRRRRRRRRVRIYIVATFVSIMRLWNCRVNVSYKFRGARRLW